MFLTQRLVFVLRGVSNAVSDVKQGSSTAESQTWEWLSPIKGTSAFDARHNCAFGDGNSFKAILYM